MNLIDKFKDDLKYAWRFLQLDLRDIPYQFNILFPKVPVHTEEERRERERERERMRGIASYVGGYCDGSASLYCCGYVTTDDIEKRRIKLGI